MINNDGKFITQALYDDEDDDYIDDKEDEGGQLVQERRANGNGVINSELNFTLEIGDYYTVGDGNSYDQHFYVVTVNLSDGTKFTVDRSYVDFVDLDRRLHKKFPRSKIPALPLLAASTLTKYLTKDPTLVADMEGSNINSAMLNSNLSNRRASVGGIRSSIVGLADSPNNKKLAFRIRKEFIEALNLKVKPLELYVQSILDHHELVASDEFIVFLDEEATSMLDYKAKEPLSVHDLLLLSTIPRECIVHKAEEFIANIPRKQLIVWRFSTKNYDIGFSVSMNNEIKVPYTRYKSHEAPVCGTLEAIVPSTCVLRWDNSYAKLHSKQLQWSTRVVTAEEFYEAKSQALECQRESKRFEMQRNLLKQCAIARASSLSGVIYTSSIVPEHTQEETFHVKELENEMKRLNGEVVTLSQSLMEFQALNEELLAAKFNAERGRELVTESWKFTASQLQNAENENKILQQENSQLEEMLKKKQTDVTQMKQLIDTSNRSILMVEQRQRELNAICLDMLTKAPDTKWKREKLMLDREHEFESIAKIFGKPFHKMVYGNGMTSPSSLLSSGNKKNRHSMTVTTSSTSFSLVVGSNKIRSNSVLYSSPVKESTDSITSPIDLNSYHTLMKGEEIDTEFNTSSNEKKLLTNKEQEIEMLDNLIKELLGDLHRMNLVTDGSNEIIKKLHDKITNSLQELMKFKEILKQGSSL